MINLWSFTIIVEGKHNMKDGLTRRDWLRRSGMLLGGATLIGPSTITGASASQRRNRSPIRMMFNENPYGPSRTARMTMTKAFEESSLYKHFGASVELKEMLAKKEGVTPEQIVIGSGSREILNVTALHYLGDGGEIVANSVAYRVNSVLVFHNCQQQWILIRSATINEILIIHVKRNVRALIIGRCVFIGATYIEVLKVPIGIGHIILSIITQTTKIIIVSDVLRNHKLEAEFTIGHTCLSTI